MNETAFFQLIAAKQVHGAYLLYGEEPYSREQAVLRILDQLDGAARELNVQFLKTPLFEEVFNACETLPFFSEQRVVRVGELSAETCAALSDYVKKVPECTILLLEFSAKPDARSALWKAMEPLDRVVEFAAFTPERAALFAEKRARERGVVLEPATARLLVERLSVDLFSLHNAVLVLAGYVGDGNRITREAVERCISPTPEFQIFFILDALVAGNKKVAVAQLTDMIQSGADSPMRLAAFFVGRVRQMLSAKAMLQHGMTEQQAIKALGGSPYAAKKTIQNARKCDPQQLANALDDFAAVDRLQKQGRMKDADVLLLAVLKNF